MFLASLCSPQQKIASPNVNNSKEKIIIPIKFYNFTPELIFFLEEKNDI